MSKMTKHQLLPRSACILLAAISILAVGIQPIFVGLVAGHFGLTLAQQSQMVSIELGGAVCGTLLYLPVVTRFGLRSIAATFGMVLLVSNLLMAWEGVADWVMTLRFVSGLCSGIMYSLAVFGLGVMFGPDRSFGVLLLFQTALYAVIAGTLPAVEAASGYEMAILLMCVCYATVLAACLGVPRRVVSSLPTVSSSTAEGSTRLGIASLLGMLLLQLAIYSLWGFVESIAADAGISAVDTGWAISIGLLGGIPGAALPSLFGGHVNRGFMIVIGALMVLGAVVFIEVRMANATDLMGAILLLNFGWNLALAYYMASVAVNDPNSHLGKLVGVVQILAAASAPAVLSLLIHGNEKQYIFMLSMGAVMASAGVGMILFCGERYGGAAKGKVQRTF